MGSHKIDIYVLYAPEFLVFFLNWPDNGPLRPKLVANWNITINIIYNYVRLSTCIVYFINVF